MVLATVVLSGLAVALPVQDPEDPDAQDRPVNRLAQETSPYLLQHRHNPVDWYPWGEEALAKARAEDKPIFLSVGYAACHWCHVMERENFEDPAIAELMNQWFVNIKVDREERPDLDEIYMAATQAMTGHGGWPMSVWMTPDLQPFFAGTYFPPRDSRGMPGFDRVLRHVHTLWTEQRESVETQSKRVTDYLKDWLAPRTDPDDPKPEHLDLAARKSAEHYDEPYGGFGSAPAFAPKFPHAAELQMLLRQHARAGDEAVLERVVSTLTAMAHGGIYDQLGGGFHRYSVDREWLVPHFEKMLYDQAQLASVYTEAWLVTGDALFERVARETLDYLLREMQDPDGGFWSSTDADSEGVEGKFFVWDQGEIEAALGERAPLFLERFGVRPGGNFEGHSILFVAESVPELARRHELSEEEVERRLAEARATLYELRAQRVPPGTDDKVLAAWNGLAIAAFAEGYRVFGEERYLAAARRAAGFVLERMRDERGRLLRSWRHGEAKVAAYLEDHAFLADALLRLFQCDFDPRWLQEAERLLADVVEHFLDESDGNFFFTADDHEELLTRAKSVAEASTPSGIAVAALAFLQAGLLLGDEELWGHGERALRANHAWISEHGIAAPTLMLAADLWLSDPREVVVVGPRDDPRTRAFVRAADRAAPRRHVVVRLDESNRAALEALTPIVLGKTPVDGAPAAYVCRRGVCEAPVTDPEALRL